MPARVATLASRSFSSLSKQAGGVWGPPTNAIPALGPRSQIHSPAGPNPSSCLLRSAEGRAAAREAGLEPELPARTSATKAAVAAPSPGEGPPPRLQLIRSPRQGKHSPAGYLTAERGGFDYVWTIEQEHFLLHRGLLWAAHTPGGQRRAWRQQADGWASPLPAGPSGLSLSRL